MPRCDYYHTSTFILPFLLAWKSISGKQLGCSWHMWSVRQSAFPPALSRCKPGRWPHLLESGKSQGRPLRYELSTWCYAVPKPVWSRHVAFVRLKEERSSYGGGLCKDLKRASIDGSSSSKSSDMYVPVLIPAGQAFHIQTRTREYRSHLWQPRESHRLPPAAIVRSPSLPPPPPPHGV